VSVKAHKNRVAELGCILCRHLGLGKTPAQLHHIREGQGMAQRASDWLVVPLCPEHHTGPRGVHGDKTDLRIGNVGELDLLALTMEALHARD
jgi:hypothetical protein